MIKKDAFLSSCGAYRFKLSREWDDRPRLLVLMFNPSTADHQIDDPTISLLCHIASHNGYGGIVVMNGIPLRGSSPDEAIRLTNQWDRLQEWHFRDRLHQNLGMIKEEVAQAGAVLVAWGALAIHCACWFENVLEEIESALPDGVQIYCLGKTAAGYPLHPLARGKLKLSKTAPLLPWEKEGSK